MKTGKGEKERRIKGRGEENREMQGEMEGEARRQGDNEGEGMRGAYKERRKGWRSRGKGGEEEVR